MNNKGFTVVELLASFALTMIITVFLFEVLVEVKDIFADTSTKTAIQQKASIISKNIKSILPSEESTISCSGDTCDINSKTLKIDQAGKKVIINGQNFSMPDTVNIKDYTLSNACSGTQCYFYVQMTLDSGNLKQEYDYDVTYYYFSYTDYEYLLRPTFSEKTNSDGKTVTINFPQECETRYVCTYQKDDGTTVRVNNSSVDVKFTSNGNLLASVDVGSKTFSSSYNLRGITNLSTDTVKGGTSSLNKTKAINDETITFNATPNDTFTYQGGTLVCSNGTQYTIDKNSKSFKITDKDCSSAVLYPSWQKDEKVIMSLSTTPANPHISQYLTDVSGTGQYLPTDGVYYYYIQFSNPQGAWSRVQVSTDSKIDITDYSTVYIDTWCTSVNNTMMVGITQSTNRWIHTTDGSNSGEAGGTYVQKGNITTNYSITERLSCNIEKYTGEWYLGMQRLYTDSYNANYCNINRVALTGTTYSYNNRGV